MCSGGRGGSGGRPGGNPYIKSAAFDYVGNGGSGRS